MTTIPNPGGTTISPAAADNNARFATTPAIPHPAYERTKPRRDKCRALFDGTPEIRKGEEAYLPRLENESDDSYNFRLVLCAVFNGYQRTVKASVGLMLEKEPELGDDMPTLLKAIAEDFDLKGTHLSVYTERIGVDGVVDGYAGSLMDFPVVEDPKSFSAGEEAKLGYRPYAVRFLANDILQIRFGKIDGVVQKTLVVLREVVEEVIGDFQVVEITRYRVYRHTKAEGVTWESWKTTPLGDTVPTIEFQRQQMKGKGKKPLSKIPFSLFAPGEQKGPFEFIPPLENLADLNIEHHQVKTNMRNLETLALVPTNVRIGAEPKIEEDGTRTYPELILGPRHTIEAPVIPGVTKPVYWHTPDTTVLDPADRSLQDIKADMGASGLAFLTPNPRRAETAEAKRIDMAAQNATVSSTSRKLQDHLEELFQMAGEYLGVPSGSITMNRDFENTVMDSAMVTALGSIAAAGNLSIETLLALLERGSVLPEGFDIAKELERILKQNMLPPANPADNNNSDNVPPGSDTPPVPPRRRKKKAAPADAGAQAQ